MINDSFVKRNRLPLQFTLKHKDFVAVFCKVFLLSVSIKHTERKKSKDKKNIKRNFW